MASTSPSQAQFDSAPRPSTSSAPRAALESIGHAKPTRSGRPTLPAGTFSALLTLGGFALCMAGGGWKAGAFNMMPRDDGIVTAGVLSAAILFAQDFKEWAALLLSAPILAFTWYALTRNHHAPFALVGAVIAFAGAVGLIARRWRAYWGPA